MNSSSFADEQEEILSSGDTQPLTIEQAIANLQGPHQGDRYYASWWLGRFRVQTPEAIAALIDALGDESDRTPEGGYPLRRNAARALGKLGDPAAIIPLIDCLNCADYYVREAAVQALGRLGSPDSIPVLINLLSGGVEAANRIPGSPHLAQPYEAILETLGTLNAQEARDVIEPFLEHPLELVKYAAARAMYQLTQDTDYGDVLIEALRGDKLPLRRAALADLGAIGYLSAAEPISQTLAENSLKLIALKGLLEHTLAPKEPLVLSEDAIRVMQLMDALL